MLNGNFVQVALFGLEKEKESTLGNEYGFTF